MIPAWRGARRRRGVLGLATITAAAALLSACVASPPEAAQGGSGGNSLNVTFGTGPTTLDPSSACTLDDTQLTLSLYVQLLQYAEKDGPAGTKQVDPTKVDPYFAKDYSVSEDGTVYTFQLQEGWTFPSGEPMNAEAVKYSFERAMKMAGCGATIINDLYQDPYLIKTIDAVNDTTLKITLNHPDGDFPLALATAASSIVDPSVVEQNGGVVEAKPNEWMGSHEAGSGPYRLSAYTPGTEATLTADPEFKGEAPATKTINVKWVKSDPTLLLQAREGQSDITFGLSKNSAKSLENDEGLTVASYMATSNMQFLMPNDKEPWTNPLVREAVTYAIPYEDILKNVVYGYGKLYYGPIPPTMPGYAEQFSQPRKTDVAKAKQLMAQAGVSTPLDVQLDVLSGDSTQASLATVLQSTLKEIGINLSVRTLDESAWSDAVYNGKATAALRLDGPAVFSAGYYLGYDEDCRSQYNTGHICVDGNSELLATARAATDTGARDRALAQLTENWVGASPKAVLYLDGSPVVVNKSVTNFMWSPQIDMRTWTKSQ
ncbi:ABC transporter substrate-binding protein [Saccharomonospora sp. NPDC046836]|uniref:ABC transporter substrate-binding protein n=1 Tax=Saccharomonospora sp. NPDC046836 TaxID=3156921 RepID=UPI0033E08080